MKAPWTDYAGNDIHEGDTLVHPDGESCTVIVDHSKLDDNDKWQVEYGDGYPSRLCLQVGYKGQAVLRDESNKGTLDKPTQDA